MLNFGRSACRRAAFGCSLKQDSLSQVSHDSNSPSIVAKLIENPRPCIMSNPGTDDSVCHPMAERLMIRGLEKGAHMHSKLHAAEVT